MFSLHAERSVLGAYAGLHRRRVGRRFTRRRRRSGWVDERRRQPGDPHPAQRESRPAFRGRWRDSKDNAHAGRPAHRGPQRQRSGRLRQRARRFLRGHSVPGGLCHHRFTGRHRLRGESARDCRIFNRRFSALVQRRGRAPISHGFRQLCLADYHRTRRSASSGQTENT